MSLAEDFYQRFKGLDRAHGIYIVKQKNLHKNKMEGKASTVGSPPTVELWERHLKGEQGLGIIPINDDAQCFWGAIDIDQYVDFDLLALGQDIEKLKLPLVLCRTKSGGAHLFLFLKEALEASLIRSKLMEWSIILGYPNVEVFPKQIKLASKEDFGNWLNMPYFNHTETTRYAYRGKETLSASDFIEFIKTYEITGQELEKIETLKNDELKDAPPCLQHLCNKGFPEGSRNKGLFNLCIFAKQKYGDEWKQKADDFNRKFMPIPLKFDEVQRTIKSADKKSYFYTCNEQPIVSVCNKAICLTRKYGIGNSKDDLGVILNSLTKIETSPPTWIIAVNSIRIELEGTEELLSQAEFKKTCVEKLNVLPNRIKSEAWEELVRSLLDRVELIEAPEDASPIGQLMHLVEEFCLSRAHAYNREEILQGKPYDEGGYTHFRSIDLIKFLTQRRFREIEKVNKLWNALKDKGAFSKTLSIQNKTIRVWAIPSFEVQTEPYTIPEVKEKEKF